MVTYRQAYIPFGQNLDIFNHADRLSVPMQLMSEIIVMGVVFVPVLFGLIGIWNLSMRSIVATMATSSCSSYSMPF